MDEVGIFVLILRYVTGSGPESTCVGFSESFNEDCFLQNQYLCARIEKGRFTFGYPGQIANFLKEAILNSPSRVHPDCPFVYT